MKHVVAHRLVDLNGQQAITRQIGSFSPQQEKTTPTDSAEVPSQNHAENENPLPSQDPVDEQILQDEQSIDDEFQMDELPIGELPIGDLPISDDAEVTAPEEEKEDDWIDLPVFGKIKVSEIGLPLFTITVGLVDGFNPCAMWVLLVLLSILVNMKDRVRIVAVAGTFVLISGIAYFLFMAAWLEVFRWVAWLRSIQIFLGILGIVVGGIHVKDFFVFKKGISLSIPESAKPVIYKRVRSIVNAQNLFGALVAAAILAVMVNIVELLCTAGLPAMYTGILKLQQFPVWLEYGYLGLYILAYMFDDALMVFVVTYTMSKTKLQETQGRLLKLISGLVILVLGVIMLFFPSWLF